MLNFDLIPEQASTYAEKVDILFYLLVAMAAFLTATIFISIAYAAYRYRYIKGEGRLSKPVKSVSLEVIWTVVPTLMFLAIFVWGLVLYLDYAKIPEGGLPIDVVAKQWMWKIQHSNGKREVNELHIPIGTPIVLTMISQDVIHDFYVPAFRVKQDVLPGRFTKLWFEPTKLGAYHLFCAEYCGTGHSLMGGTVYVMEPEAYAAWLEGGSDLLPREAGALLFEQRGCLTCHSAAPGSRGPDLAGVYASTVRLITGVELIADEEYLRESIVESAAKVVEGYTALMPSFRNQLTEEEVFDLIAYLKSIGGEEAGGN